MSRKTSGHVQVDAKSVTPPAAAVSFALQEEQLLDDAIEQTFPASDPVASLPSQYGLETAVFCDDEEEFRLDNAIALTFPASDPVAFTPRDKLGGMPRVVDVLIVR